VAINRVLAARRALKEADLSGADLSFASLSEATNLSGANLGFANLSGADLSGADLSRANPSGARAFEFQRPGLQEVLSPDVFDTIKWEPDPEDIEDIPSSS
jgi:hypothetical protein